MKIFDPSTGDSTNLSEYDQLTEQMTNMIIKVCERLMLRLEVVHFALWLFHCQVKMVGYHKFDRFIYACGSILIATKICEMLKYPIDIVKQMRAYLRQQKGRKDQDSQEKTKKIVKKVIDSEINIMITLGFDFDIEIALIWIPSLEEQLKDSHLIEKLKQAITSLYKTNVVLYFESQWIALTALSIVLNQHEIVPQLRNYSKKFLENLKSQKIKDIRSFYIQKNEFLFDNY